jgi:hypothetical protein
MRYLIIAAVLATTACRVEPSQEDKQKQEQAKADCQSEQPGIVNESCE